MIKVRHAILHVCDFVSCVNVFSVDELDLSDKATKSYVGKVARKCLGAAENRHGEFSAESGFAGELRAYFAGQRDFAGLSTQVAEYVAGELGRMEAPDSTDVLVVDFDGDAPKVEPKDVSAGDDDEGVAAAAAELDAAVDAAYEARRPRYFGIVLLESRPAFMHEVGSGEAGATVGIAKHHAILPNPSQKVSSYAVIDADAMSVAFCDHEREIAGERRWLIPEGLLQCSMEASSKEVLDTVARVAGEVAEEYGGNAAVAASKAKAYVAETAGESEYLAPWDMGAEVFDDEPMQRRFEEALREEELPERVSVANKGVQRMAKSHKIRTDTGIEITFPSEYSHNPDFIEFVSAPDGTISIELKNIAHIENR